MPLPNRTTSIIYIFNHALNGSMADIQPLRHMHSVVRICTLSNASFIRGMVTMAKCILIHVLRHIQFTSIYFMHKYNNNYSKINNKLKQQQ